MKFKIKTITAWVGIICAVAFTLITASPKAKAFFSSPDGGIIAASIPCVSTMGFGFWTIKTNNITPVIYLYPSKSMRQNYLAPMIGIATLGFVGPYIDCTTTTFPPVTLTGRVSTMYGTGLGF